MPTSNGSLSEEQLALLHEAAHHDGAMKDLCSFKTYIELVEWFREFEDDRKNMLGEVERERISSILYLLDYTLDVILSYRGAVRGMLAEGCDGLPLRDVPMDRESIAGMIKQFVVSPITRDHDVAIAIRRAIGIEVMNVEAFAQEDAYNYLETVVSRVACDNSWSAWSDCLHALVMLPSEEQRQQSGRLFLASVRSALMKEDWLRRLELLKLVMCYCEL